MRRLIVSIIILGITSYSYGQYSYGQDVESGVIVMGGLTEDKNGLKHSLNSSVSSTLFLSTHGRTIQQESIDERSASVLRGGF